MGGRIDKSIMMSDMSSMHNGKGCAAPLRPLPEWPTVSIVVPSFNQGRFIRDTIESILSQDYRPLTIHVIDGGSKDETVDVLRSYGDLAELRWLSEPDKAWWMRSIKVLGR